MRAKQQTSAPAGYMLIEALVYIGVVLILLGIGYAALYRCIDNSVVLRRNADDIATSLRAGERWRADVRGATDVRLEGGGTVLHLVGPRGEVEYKFADGMVLRRKASARWTSLVENVKASAMDAFPGQKVTCWHWELELQPRGKASVKASRVRPLFTFIGVPEQSPTRLSASYP